MKRVLKQWGSREGIQTGDDRGQEVNREVASLGEAPLHPSWHLFPVTRRSGHPAKSAPEETPVGCGIGLKRFAHTRLERQVWNLRASRSPS